MSKQINELRDKHAKLITDAKALMAKETVSAEDRTNFDKMLADANELQNDIKRIETVEALDVQNRSSVRPPQGQPGAYLEESGKEDVEARDKQEMVAFRKFIVGGSGRLTAEDRKVLRPFDADTRDLSIGTTTAGGYLIPQGFQKELDAAIKQWGAALNAVRPLNTDSGAPMPFPTSNDVSQKSVVLAEGSAASESDMSFGQVMSNVSQFTTGVVKVSNLLLQDSAFDLNAWIRDSFAVRVARGLNYAITNAATNVSGLLASATAGATSAAPTALAYGDFVNTYAALEPGYLPSASWMMSNATRVYLMGLVDSYGRPLFVTSVNSGVLESIMGQPIVINNDMPAIGATNVAVLFGDFSKYILRSAQSLAIARLVERYAEYNQTGFVGFHRNGGILVDAGTHPLIKLTQHA